MNKGKLIKNLALALIIIGFITMIISYVKTDNINYLLGGLVIVSVGSIITSFIK